MTAAPLKPGREGKMSTEPKFQHEPLDRLTVSHDEIRGTEWYQWKFDELNAKAKYSKGVVDAAAIGAYRSSAYDPDDYTNDAEGRYL